MRGNYPTTFSFACHVFPTIWKQAWPFFTLLNTESLDMGKYVECSPSSQLEAYL